MKKSRAKRVLAMLLTFVLTVGEFGTGAVNVYAAGETGDEGDVILSDGQELETLDDAIIEEPEIISDEEAKSQAGDLSDKENADTEEPLDREDAPVSENTAAAEDEQVSGNAVEEVTYPDAVDITAPEDITPDGDNGFEKTASNTLYGTKGMRNPRKPLKSDDAWEGSYVYYGNHNGAPVRYRVLERYCDHMRDDLCYNAQYDTVLLECDRPIFESPFDSKTKNWKDSSLRKGLNGSLFLESDHLTSYEKDSIVNTYRHDTKGLGNGQEDLDFARMSNPDRVFILDAKEITAPLYGYYNDSGNAASHRKSASGSKGYWLRSPHKSNKGQVGIVSTDGTISESAVNNTSGVCPAFNVCLKNVLFSSAVSGDKGELNANYKFTMEVPTSDWKLTIPEEAKTMISGSRIRIPYSVTGPDAGEVNAISVVFLDRTYETSHTDDIEVLYYDRLLATNNRAGDFVKSGTGYFDLPSAFDLNGMGVSYWMYIIAEDINGKYESDYASRPIEIKKSDIAEAHTVTFDTKKRGTSVLPQTVIHGSAVKEPNKPQAEGWVFKGWYTSETDHSSSKKYDFSTPVNSDLTLYGYWVEEHTVTFFRTDVPDRNTPPTQYVEHGSYAEEPPKPEARNYEFVGWFNNEARSGAKYDFANTPVTADLKLYDLWKKTSNCNVVFDMNGKPGTAPATRYVTPGSKVAKPNDPVTSDGWVFGGWYTAKTCKDSEAFDFDNTNVMKDLKLYAKWTDKLNLWINNVQVGKDNLNGPGYSYNVSEHELKLDNITLNKVYCKDNAYSASENLPYIYAKGMIITVTGSGHTVDDTGIEPVNRAGIYIADGDLILDADLTIENTGMGLYAERITINGGSINIKSNADKRVITGTRYKYPYGIYSADFIKLNNGNLKVELSGEGATAVSTSRGKLELNRGSFTARIDRTKGSELISLPANGLIDNSLYFIKPVDGRLDESGRKFTDAYGEEVYDVELVEEDSLLRMVTFDLNGQPGMPPSPQLVKEGTKARTPQTPTAVGYDFTGWYTSSSCTESTKFDFSSQVNWDLVLYAGWSEKDEFYVTFTDLAEDIYSGLYQTTDGSGNPRYETAYTGAAIKPEVLVTGADGVQLTEGVDYTLKYSNNKNVDKKGGPAKVTVKGKGNFTSNKVIEFYIVPADLQVLQTRGRLIVPTQSVKKGGVPSPELYYGTYRLKAKDMSYDKSKVAAGTFLSVAGKGNFTGSVFFYLKVVDKVVKTDAIKIKVKAGKHVYDKEKHTLTLSTPTTAGELTVTDGTGKTVLTEGTDFEVKYENNKNAGKATVIVTAKGSYRGVASATFKILPDSAVDVSVGLAAEGPVYYDPAGARPKFDVIENKIDAYGFRKILTEGSDYTVSYANNKKPGTGKYTIKFKGNYKGRKPLSGTFKIEKAAFTVSVKAPDMTYKKPGKYYSKVLVTYGKTLLKEKKDYTVEYYQDYSCTSPLPAKYVLTEDSMDVFVKVSGTGNFAGDEVSASYRLCKLTPTRTTDLSKARIVDKSTGKKVKKQEYTGREVKPYIEVQVKDGKTWKNVDPTLYEVTFYNNVNKGKATILVNARGSKASGSKTANFRIGTRSLGMFSWMK